MSIAEDVGIHLEDAEQIYLAGIGGYVRAYVKEAGENIDRRTRRPHDFQ